jgi:hypothetical protein
MKNETRTARLGNLPARTADHQLARLEKLVMVSADRHTPLNVVLVYEDDQTREWAKAAYDRVTGIAIEQGVRPTWWKLNNLSDPGVLAAAVSTAARADVIVIAIRDTEGLPLPFYAWTSAWVTNRRQWSGVMISMLGTPWKGQTNGGRIGDYLRSLSHQARLEFILETRVVKETLPAANLDRAGRRNASVPAGLHRNPRYAAFASQG